MLTNCHKSRGLKQYTFIVFQLPQSEVWVGWGRFLCSKFHQAEIKASAGLCSLLEPLGMNLLPGSFRLLAESASLWILKAPVSLLAVRQAFSPPRGGLHSLSCFLWGTLSICRWSPSPSHVSDLSDFLSATSLCCLPLLRCLLEKCLRF